MFKIRKVKEVKEVEEIIDKERVIEDYRGDAKKISCLTKRLVENEEKMKEIINECLGHGIKEITFSPDIITVQYSENDTLTLASLKKLEEILDTTITLRVSRTPYYDRFSTSYIPIIEIRIEYGCD